MKFTILMLKNMIPEWIKLYLNYKLLKAYLSNAGKLRRHLERIKIQSCNVAFQQKKRAIL